MENGPIRPLSAVIVPVISAFLHLKYVGFNLSAGQIEFYNERTFEDNTPEMMENGPIRPLSAVIVPVISANLHLKYPVSPLITKGHLQT